MRFRDPKFPIVLIALDKLLAVKIMQTAVQATTPPLVEVFSFMY